MAIQKNNRQSYSSGNSSSGNFAAEHNLLKELAAEGKGVTVTEAQAVIQKGDKPLRRNLRAAQEYRVLQGGLFISRSVASDIGTRNSEYFAFSVDQITEHADPEGFKGLWLEAGDAALFVPAEEKAFIKAGTRAKAVRDLQIAFEKKGVSVEVTNDTPDFENLFDGIVIEDTENVEA